MNRGKGLLGYPEGGVPRTRGDEPVHEPREFFLVD
jgi:hypothetical protein